MLIYAYIQPNSSQTEFAEKILIDSLKFGLPAHSEAVKNNQIETHKIKLKSPPVDNAANEELIKFISKYYKVPKTHITIKKGLKSRYKIIEISD